MEDLTALIAASRITVSGGTVTEYSLSIQYYPTSLSTTTSFSSPSGRIFRMNRR
ncbi:MAG: hypothetical protein R2942_08600 [Ignavibacteria bacterium]